MLEIEGKHRRRPGSGQGYARIARGGDISDADHFSAVFDPIAATYEGPLLAHQDHYILKGGRVVEIAIASP